MPSAPNTGLTLGGKKTKKKMFPDLVDDNNGKHFGKFVVNKLYHIYYMGRAFAKNVSWFISCIGFMYLLPMGIEYMSE